MRTWLANSIEPGQTARKAGRPGSILVPKTYNNRVQQDNGLYSIAGNLLYYNIKK